MVIKTIATDWQMTLRWDNVISTMLQVYQCQLSQSDTLLLNQVAT